MVWCPNTNVVTVDMTKIGGTQARASWWNPDDNTTTLIGIYATNGSMSFTPSSARRVLILDSVDITQEVISVPTTLSGPLNGYTGSSYKFSTGGSSSSLGSNHPMEYQFDWGDGTFSSWGSPARRYYSQSHVWIAPGIYQVMARARCANHTSVFSSWTEPLSVTINSVPSPPTEVQASDGNYMDKVEITWTASPEATSYTVYRATSLSRRASKTNLGTTSETYFNDTTAVPMKTYYYYVMASNTYGTSNYSAYDTGYRSDGRPSVPTNVQASDGAYADRVRISWAASSGATSYTVYRATSTSRRATKVPVGTTTDTTFDDITASVAKTYYYYVTASNSYGESGFSAYDTGFR
jgi:cellulose 1,4-beta-cellobiosidase